MTYTITITLSADEQVGKHNDSCGARFLPRANPKKQNGVVALCRRMQAKQLVEFCSGIFPAR